MYGPSNYKSYIHLDHLGNVRVITDSSETVKLSMRYEPYGNLWSTSGPWYSHLKYLQRVRDEVTGGLCCLGVRFYDAEIGRFISEDPVLGDIKTPQTLNRYSYSICDPINGKDPNGRFFFLLALIGAAVGAVVNAAFYLGECALGLREFDLVELVGEIAIGAVTGAITGLTLGLGSAAGLAKVGTKVAQIGSKISNIGSKIAAMEMMEQESKRQLEKEDVEKASEDKETESDRGEECPHCGYVNLISATFCMNCEMPIISKAGISKIKQLAKEARIREIKRNHILTLIIFIILMMNVIFISELLSLRTIIPDLFTDLISLNTGIFDIWAILCIISFFYSIAWIPISKPRLRYAFIAIFISLISVLSYFIVHSEI
ncbi:MAG: hypothetical protein OEV21_02890 [Thermoplasmata archaeon]|nr:hypothetical protein [Thermoplasmata archaeon]